LDSNASAVAAYSEDIKYKLSSKAKKKKKKPPTDFVFFDEPLITLPASSTSTSTSAEKSQISDYFSMHVPQETQRHRVASTSNASALQPTRNVSILDANICETSVEVEEDPESTNEIYYSTSAKSVDGISMYSDCSDRLDNISLSDVSADQRFKPVVLDEESTYADNECRGFNLTRNRLTLCNLPDSRNYGNSCDPSQDLIPVPNYDVKSHKLLSVSDNNASCSGPMYSIADLNRNSPTDSSESNSRCDKNTSETRPQKTFYNHHSWQNHSVSTTNTCFTAGERISSCSSESSGDREKNKIQKLKFLLDREIEFVAVLKSQLLEEERKSNDKIKLLESKCDCLSKENEILKQQLKKYICAVQLLKKQSSRQPSGFEENSEEFLASLDGIEGNDTTKNNSSLGFTLLYPLLSNYSSYHLASIQPDILKFFSYLPFFHNYYCIVSSFILKL